MRTVGTDVSGEAVGADGGLYGAASAEAEAQSTAKAMAAAKMPALVAPEREWSCFKLIPFRTAGAAHCTGYKLVTRES